MASKRRKERTRNAMGRSDDMRRKVREGDPALKRIERECVEGKPLRMKEERHVEGKNLNIRQTVLPPFHTQHCLGSFCCGGLGQGAAPFLTFVCATLGCSALPGVNHAPRPRHPYQVYLFHNLHQHLSTHRKHRTVRKSSHGILDRAA